MQTQFLELYRVDGMICGTPLRGVTTYQLRLEYERCFNFQGQTACYFLVTGDDTIGRAEALRFATDDAKGRLVHIHIDLSKNKVTKYRTHDEREL